MLRCRHKRDCSGIYHLSSSRATTEKNPLSKYNVPSHPPPVLYFAVTSLSYFSTSNGFCRVRINSLPKQSQNTSGWSVPGKDLCLLGQTDSCPSPRRFLQCWPGDLQPPLNQRERLKRKNSGGKEKNTLKPFIYKTLLELHSIHDSTCCYYYWKKF